MATLLEYIENVYAYLKVFHLRLDKRKFSKKNLPPSIESKRRELNGRKGDRLVVEEGDVTLGERWVWW